MRLGDDLVTLSGLVLLKPPLGAPVILAGRLGEGGTSVVHRAEWIDGTDLALKVLAPRAGADGRPYRGTWDTMKESFHRECRILDRLSGTDGMPHLLWKGVVIGSGAPAPAFAMRLLQPVIDSDLTARLHELRALVRMLHGLGVVHLDIKPRNVMVDAVGRLVLIDFGSALMKEDAESGRALLTSSRSLLAETPFESWLDRPLCHDSWDDLVSLDIYLLDRMETKI